MKKLFSFFAIVMFLSLYLNANSQVLVNPGAISYPTLGQAFVAINSGVHTGVVSCLVTGSTVETIPAFLNSSGTGSASYISVTVTTSVVATIEGNLTGASVINLVGADNVIIDGSIGGVGRNLTVRNNSNGSNATAIWLSSISATPDSNGCTNNIIRNLEISCNARVDSSALSTFGILAGGSTIGNVAGRNNDNNRFLNNRIIKCRYGILLNGGAAANRSDNNIISGNIVGPDLAGTDNIGKAGIFAQFQDNCMINDNVVQNVGGTFAGTTGGADRIGIGAGSESWSSTPTTTTGGNYTVMR
ncbi:MAG: hypothetical protein ABIY50_00490, partial [Ignavibacteria bacterium]